ncbi:MAG: glutathione S-transferase family protein [Deltaproteobacteria bacterium]
MKLWDVAFSSNCRRVRIAARELGIPLEKVPLEPFKGETQAPGYLGVNPMGKVPTIDDDGFVLWESSAILVYLAGKAPSKGLYPTEPRRQADALRWLFWHGIHVGAHVTTLALERFLKPKTGGGAPDPAVCAAAEKELLRFVPVLVARLASRPHVLDPFPGSTDGYSIVDIAMGCSYENAPRVSYDLGPYPNLRGWLARLQSRPAWKE